MYKMLKYIVINKTKICLCEDINKIDKYLALLSENSKF